MTGSLFSEKVQAELALRDRGLERRTFIGAEAPVVVPMDLTIELPDGLGEGHGYGTVEEFVAYVREINRIPMEATEEHQRTEGFRTMFRVVFRWWEVTMPTADLGTPR